jgi:predicted phosphoadenosine phosphosulfate sulfurtransferase
LRAKAREWNIYNLAMAPCSVRSVSGFAQIAWQIMQVWKRRRAASWMRVQAKVEGHEVLVAGSNGWVVAFYSYSLNGEQFTGEWRKWFIARMGDYQSAAAKIIDRVSQGKTIDVRVDPQRPTNSVADISA